MIEQFILEVYYDRFGVLVRPYSQLLGFNYNRVYYSVEDVMRDFWKHGWQSVRAERGPDPFSGMFHTFRRRNP